MLQVKTGANKKMTTNYTPESLALEVGALVASRRDEYIEIMRRVCAMPCKSQNKEGLHAVALMYREMMEGLGMSVVLDEQASGTCVVGLLPGADHNLAPIVFVGHIDTVYDDVWPLRVEGDKLIGPGVQDMNGANVLVLEVLRALRDIGYMHARPVKVLLACGEELNNSDRTDVAFVTQQLAGAHEVVVLEGADVTSDPATHGAIAIARKGGMRLRVTAQGRGGHMKDLATSVNAIEALADFIGRIEKMRPVQGVIFSPNLIDGGTGYNTVARRAEAMYDMRYDTPLVWGSFLLRVKERAKRVMEKTGAVIQIRVDQGKSPMVYHPRSDGLIQRAKSGAALFGFELPTAHVDGVSDAGTASDLGLPVVDRLGWVGGHDHRSGEEYSDLSTMERVAGTQAYLIATSA
jgi:glutamate carboxypeptidase